ncbi:MAG: hypothetical protein GF329_13710 [Candidatus Lokiarchaeota archaeon]|nr:hypothetical protein [Candidatus Lokiarchaeota archaeon]
MTAIIPIIRNAITILLNIILIIVLIFVRISSKLSNEGRMKRYSIDAIIKPTPAIATTSPAIKKPKYFEGP